ncbi:hypothetical protein CSA80_01455 [Candidatus Saccharibacteria bacterium]|nr:MAG: hypothetical protein CSA80_01455 [Candidatus Saccharibacteria bacterium]
MMTRKKLILACLAATIAAASLLVYTMLRSTTPDPRPTQPKPPKPAPSAPRPTPPPTLAKNRTPTFDKQRFSLDDPQSLWVVVNKRRPLQPATYTPADLTTPNVPLRAPGRASMQLRRDAAAALEAMFAAAKQAGAPMMVSSGYRSYTVQTSLYKGYTARYGQAAADSFSARPGHSEHQTGLAVDVAPTNWQCVVEACFAELPAGQWVAAHAWEFGFIVRYPADKTAITGYTYEPWHLRYTGKELAKEMHTKGVTTLEAFFELPPAPDYRS